jgi:hypothetical protein
LGDRTDRLIEEGGRVVACELERAHEGATAIKMAINIGPIRLRISVIVLDLASLARNDAIVAFTLPASGS